MERDSRNPKVPLLKKFDIPVDHLSYEYIETCSNQKELERMIRILRLGEEGYYPDLLKFTEDRLKKIAPGSRALRVETPILTKNTVSNEAWNALEKELLSWEEEMKEMDKSLDFEKTRIDAVGSKSMPEIRKVAPPKPKNEPKKTKVQINSKNERIKSGDYASWEKFDVDKELLKMDVEEERKQEENEKKKREIKKQIKEKKLEIQEIDKDSYSNLERQVLANQAKDRGNECYKSGDWENAIKYYDISIKLFETANAFNNRAMAYLKLKAYEDAIKDCNRVLDLEKNNIKALHRRATAYQNMSDRAKDSKNYDELALQDLLLVVQLEPNNKVAQADLQKLKKKLNIEDVGKKFRMPISENLLDSDKENYYKPTEKKSTFNIKDEPLFSEKLPLTYYGPSTSTFQCEPYSLVHRALSGSAIPGQILCKCNSNKQKQNPLCQRCGEAMCKPKPVNKAKTNVKRDNEAKNLILKDSVNQNQSVGGDKSLNNAIRDNSEKHKVDENKVFSKKEEKGGLESASEKVDSTKKVDTVQKDLVEPVHSDVSQNEKSNTKILGDDNKLKENTEIKPDLNSSIKVNSNNKNHINSSSTIVECNKKVLGDIGSLEKITLDDSAKTKEGNKSNEIKLKDTDSSQNQTSQTTKKSKHKKKKSKERKENKLGMLMEPVKVVHAAKYLHPTSKEPKIETQTSKEIPEKVNTCVEGQFKPFVRNKKSLSVEAGRMSTTSGAFGAKITERSLNDNSSVKRTIIDVSSEGNKENILEEKQIGNSNSELVKKDSIESAYEFVKTWEQLKKVDDGYVKRAEILRNIKPFDLGKVIGIKLDSDMLSCLLECFERHIVETDPNIVIEFLKQLPQVPRFGLITMFLAEKDKNKMKKLIETAESKGFKLDGDTKKKFGVE